MTEKRVSEISPEFPVDTPTNQPKGYKLSELGFIPEDWSVSTVKDISAIPMQNGLFYEPKRKGKGVPLINVGDMYKSAPVNVESLELFDANINEIKIFKAAVGDLFFTRSSVVPSGIAFCNIYNSKQENVVFDSHLIRVRPNKELVNPNYLYLNCIAKHARSALIASAKTATMTTIDQGAINRCPVLLPPIKEQTAIANALSDVDALIQELEKLIAKKQAIKTATMQQLLTGRTRLPQFAHHPDGRKKGYKPSELGEIPEDWEASGLASMVSTLNAGVSVNSIDRIDAFTHGKHILKTSCVTSGYFNESEIKSILPIDLNRAKCSPEAGCIIVSRMNTPALVGEIGYVSQDYPEMFLPDRLWQMKFKADSSLNSRWLAYVLSYPSTAKKIKEAATGTSDSMKNISKGGLLALRILTPSFNEQTAIATILSDMDEEIQALDQRLNKTRQIKQGMMQELLTGKTRLVKPAGAAE
ncbi:restriction endonuclease subunit S [Vibrio cholerae]|nr:restriction endonuclease subunit S [Vibrio cholerae]